MTVDKKLKKIRKRLDQIDRRILEALGDRQAAAEEAAGLKAESGELRVRDIDREQTRLGQLVEQAAELGLDGYYVTRLFREIMEQSLRRQHEIIADRRSRERRDRDTLTVAYQGVEGAYSHIAATKHFGPRKLRLSFRPCESFASMLQAVKAGAADYGVLPIENTTAGSINEAYDLLASTNLTVVGEEVLLIEHCLVALEQVPVEHIRRIFSHPQALAQCSNYLSRLHRCTVESFPDTAMAVKKIRAEKDISQAAIASQEAAELYGLEAIERGIANQKDNYTRFVIVAEKAAQYDARIPCKTSLIFATRHEKGALSRCLNVLSGHGLNLTKLESRPRPNVPWEYLFYLDFEGNLQDAGVKSALDELTAHTGYLKVLGCYPARTTPEARPASPRAKPAGRKARRAARVSETPPAGAAAPGAEGKPYRLVLRTRRTRDTCINVNGVRIGSGRPVVMAGPAFVESREQITACARAAKKAGVDVLWGGCFRGPVAAGEFEGLGFEGLRLLESAGRSAGLPVATEVLDPADLPRAAKRADMIAIGGRNMQNFALLRAAGQVDRPVILRRGLLASIDDWLAAAEQILSTGNQQVVLCERGIRTLAASKRNTLDLSALPLLRETTHLPLLTAPSQASDSPRWVPSLAEASLAAGAQGVLVEFHPRPAKALEGSEQALSIEGLQGLMERLSASLE
jgi:chorismate mutase/prephenate dehydratase